MAITLDLSAEAKEYVDEANRASDPASGSWLAFLLLLTYVVVTLAGVSHKALLLNSPVKLPIINADIPLVGFFQYAPLLFLLVYLSLLVQHVVLARKYRKFTDAIAPYEMETGTEHPLRERVHSYVFSQIAAGPKPNLITKFMMQLIVYVTFSVLPIITLLYFQIKFLPYHDVSITYWHRLAVILGFAMLILLTPLMQNTGPTRRRWDIKVGPQAEAWEASGTQVLLVLFLLPLVVGFSWLLATVPDEWIDRRLGFVAPASVRAGPEQEAKLLNPGLFESRAMLVVKKMSQPPCATGSLRERRETTLCQSMSTMSTKVRTAGTSRTYCAMGEEKTNARVIRCRVMTSPAHSRRRRLRKQPCVSA